MVAFVPHSTLLAILVRIVNLIITARAQQLQSYLILYSPVSIYYGLQYELASNMVYHITVHLASINTFLYFALKAAASMLQAHFFRNYIHSVIIEFIYPLILFYNNSELLLISLLSALIDSIVMTCIHLRQASIDQMLDYLGLIGVNTIIMNSTSILHQNQQHKIKIEDCNKILISSECMYYKSQCLEFNQVSTTIGCHTYDIIWAKFQILSFTRAVIVFTINRESIIKSQSDENDILFASSAHEIRNPLNSLTTILELSIEQLESSNIPKALDHINDAKFSVDHALSIARNLLDLSVIKKREIQLDVKKIAFRQIINSIYKTFLQQLMVNSIYLQLHVDENVPFYIYTDKMRLTQVIFNLISNSSKFTPQGGIISIAVKTISYKYIQISVEDTGIGIRKDDISKLGIAFSKINHDKSINACGIGLGLMISKQLASLLGTGLNFSSEQNKGSKFWFDVETGLKLEDIHFFSNISQINSPQESVHSLSTKRSSIIPIYTQKPQNEGMLLGTSSISELTSSFVRDL